MPHGLWFLGPIRDDFDLFHFIACFDYFIHLDSPHEEKTIQSKRQRSRGGRAIPCGFSE
jgi:hypothetical protein